MHSTEEASKFGWWKCQNRSLILVKKNSQAYCKQLADSTLRAWLKFTPRRTIHSSTSTPLDLSTFSTTQLLRITFRHGKLSSPTTPLTILLEFVVRYKIKDNNPLIILTYSTSKLYHLLLNSSKTSANNQVIKVQWSTRFMQVFHHITTTYNIFWTNPSTKQLSKQI